MDPQGMGDVFCVHGGFVAERELCDGPLRLLSVHARIAFHVVSSQRVRGVCLAGCVVLLPVCLVRFHRCCSFGVFGCVCAAFS